MTSYEIIQRLRAGQTLAMRDYGTREERQTLAALYDRGLLHVEQLHDYGVLAVRLKRRRLVRVRVVERTWYGFRVTTQVREILE